MHILAPLLLACAFVHEAALADRNVTVDNTASSIVYQPVASWSSPGLSPLDYQGSHYLSQDRSATATFTFTGVAVYFLSPKWPYSVTTQLSLDGGPADVVSLVDFAGAGGSEETVNYSAVWWRTGLANAQHQLVASMDPNGQFVVVDGFTYTVLDSSTGTSSSSLSSSTGTSSAPPSSTSSSPPPSSTSDNSSSHSSHSNLIAPIVGAVAGVVGLVALAAILLFCCQRRGHRDSSVIGTARGSQSAGGSIGPGSSSFHFSQAGVMSPAPSVITTNLAGYGAYRQQMPPLLEEQNYPAPSRPFAARHPQMHSAYYPEGPADPARAMRAYASDPALGAAAPDADYDPRALYEMGASPIARLSTVVEGSASSGGGSAHARRSADYGYHGTPVDGSPMLFETRSSGSSYPSTSGSKGYTGREHGHTLDQKEYMSDQKTFASSGSSPSRLLSPGPPAYSAGG